MSVPPHAARLEALLAERILLLDGAMGTMIQRARLAEEDYRGQRFRDWGRELKGNNDLLSLTQPALVRDIHAQYLQAGADIIETNTFNSTAVALADYGMRDLAREFNRAAANLARDAVREAESKNPQRPRFVAGVLGPAHPADRRVHQLRPRRQGAAGLCRSAVSDRRDARLVPSERRTAERLRRVRRHARGDGGTYRRMGEKRLAQHRRRLLRHHAGAYPR